ncbi:MAG: hypothetical protein IKA19_06485 [Muribaculaceae bacterium]|nr:hypothetical protein [Muribaculaceae bacterium]MBR1964320.1 hypothetical protein [Muribaculaceae bacterium]
MKKVFALMLCIGALSMTSNAQIGYERNLEGRCVATTEAETSGYAEAESLSPDGRKIEKWEYKWYSGTAKANDKQTAIEMAQREAYATISRTINNAVIDAGERATSGCNGNVSKALNSRWLQVSESVIRGCEPFGNAKIEYDRCTGMYTVTAKVAIRGDRFNKMLDEVANYRPTFLTVEEINVFVDVNVNIVNIVRGY